MQSETETFIFAKHKQGFWIHNIHADTNWQLPWFRNKKPFMVQTWLCYYLYSTLCVLCILIVSLKPSRSRRWPDQDLQWLAGSSVRNGPGWHVSAMINEQVFGSVLSKWSHYWWPQSSLCVASISDDFQGPAAVKGDVVILWVKEGLSLGPGCSDCHGRVKLSYLDWWPQAGKFIGTGTVWQPLCDWLWLAAVMMVRAESYISHFREISRNAVMKERWTFI